MKSIYICPNCFFIEHEDDKYCFSYYKNVAAIINGNYIEFQGDKFYSKTSRIHKSKFKKYYNVEASA